MVRPLPAPPCSPPPLYGHPVTEIAYYHFTRIHLCRSGSDANMRRMEPRLQYETRSDKNESSSCMLGPSADDRSSASPLMIPPPRGPRKNDTGTEARGTGGGFDCDEQFEDFIPSARWERRQQQGAASAAVFAFPTPGGERGVSTAST